MDNPVIGTLIESFKEMLEIETSMDETYQKLIQSIEDPQITEVLRWIQGDEKKHASNVQKILNILSED